jgi:hypothetical protein
MSYGLGRLKRVGMPMPRGGYLPIGLIVAVLATALLLPGVMAPSAAAQEATPAAVNCAPPDLVPPPTTASATPIATISTPEATPAASPVALQAITPIDAGSAATIESLTRSLAACLTEGDAEGVADLVTERYLGAVYGGGRPLARIDYLVLADSAPIIPVRILSVSDVSLDLPSTASAIVVSVVGSQLREERWAYIYRTDVQGGTAPDQGPAPSDGTVIEGGGTLDPADAAAATPAAEATQLGQWFVQGVTALSVTAPADASAIDVTVTEYEFNLSDAEVDGPAVVLRGQNAGEEDHEMLVLRLDAGVTTAELLRPTINGFPAGIDVVGQLLLPAGTSGDLVLVDLEPDTYHIVSLLPDPSGVPHLALGEEATFTVR